MFASPELAARIDRAEGRLVSAIARSYAERWPDTRTAVFEIAGGTAVFVDTGSPTNKMIGAGFDAVAPEDDLRRLESAFADRGAPLQAEVSTLADPAFHGQLVSRGYEPKGFENVLGHPLGGIDETAAEGLRIELAEGNDIAELIEAAVQAWAHPDTGGVGGDAIPPDHELRRWLELTASVAGFESVAARLDGRVVGCAWLRLDAGVAQLCGAATLPAFRRRGIQTALLRWRLRRAREAGCDVATVTTQPASKSQQNVQREGFHLLYARQLLVRGQISIF